MAINNPVITSADTLQGIAEEIQAKDGDGKMLDTEMRGRIAALEVVSGGFTGEKFKTWLEFNGYTITEFTLISEATSDFNINHQLGRTANSIICFRADLDGTVNTGRRVDFALALDGSTADTDRNRLRHYTNIYQFAAIGISAEDKDYFAVIANTSEYITFRVTGTPFYSWESGKYYLAVI